MRLRIDLAYDGTDFRGWATQPGLRTVQAELGDALAMALRVPRVDLVCAGRTDAGVHARGQVVHTDLAEDVVPDDLARLARRLNGILPADVRVRSAVEAPAGFDARYSALWRRYTYRIADRAETVDPLARAHVLTWSRELDLDAMNAASAVLLGRHDFASFCKQRVGATTIRTLLDLTWARDGWGLASASVRADAFCHSMVRSLVGCLISIGEGRRPVEWAEHILGAERRDPGVTVAPARGLTLEQVAYPADEELRDRARQTRARRSISD
ncbi:tRNA pseudouridine(38-40) synthase TruA [soil metagenome]